MITYLIDGKKFSLSYQELREGYINFCEMSDEDFASKAKEALHLACVICFLKEVPTYICLSDKGIIHEIAHMLHIGDGNTSTIKEIRECFKETLRLS